MTSKKNILPDNTAVRTALWRALHVEIDSPPHIFEDVIGLKLVAPDEGWRNRPDMSPFTKPFRASIVARARCVEDLLLDQLSCGLTQYVILGAGLDTFLQRKPELVSRVQVFEIDQPSSQEWKSKRLIELGFGISPSLHLVPVDFEAGETWVEKLEASGFNFTKPAVVASTGVSMYLTKEANLATLKQVATFKQGSIFAMSFMLPLFLNDPDIRPGVERAAAGAKANGTPWLSFFTPEEIVAMAHEAGFSKVEHISGASLAKRYFSNRSDGLRPPNNAEELIVATA